MNTILHSRRMAFRPTCSSDAEQIFEFLGDCGAMQYTQVVSCLAECRSKVMCHEAQRETVGYAPWSIMLDRSDKIVGWGGIYVDPNDKSWGLEIGYFFSPSVWGKGLASEFVLFCCSFLGNRGWSGELLSFSHPQNYASARVLERNGFKEKYFRKDLNRHIWGKVFNGNAPCP